MLRLLRQGASALRASRRFLVPYGVATLALVVPRPLGASAGEATLYRGGTILTMAGPRPATVEALVERGGRIVYVGSLAGAQRLLGTKGRQVDLAGAALLPGFIDAHGHFLLASQTLLDADLRGVNTIPALLERLRIHASQGPPGEWIVGMGYRLEQLAERRHPSRAELDWLGLERPVFVLDGSGHQGVINTRLRQALGWETGPRGIDGRVAEAEVFAVLGARPPRSAERVLEGVRRAVALWTSQGQTTASELAYGLGPQDLQVVRQLEAERLLPIDLQLYARHQAIARVAAAHRHWLAGGGVDPQRPDGDRRYHQRLRLAGVKMFLDGNLQATEDLERFDGPATMVAVAEGLARDRRWPGSQQLAAHGVGVQAADHLLEAVARIRQRLGPADRRPVLHHAVLLRPDQIARARQLGVWLSFTAAGLYPLGDGLRARLAPHQQGWLGPIGSVERAGVPFTLHHDVPTGVSPSLLLALWNAVNRRTRSGAVLGPEERISVYDGLRALTIEAARQSFEEKSKGSLEVGKLADFVVLSADPLQVPPLELSAIRVLQTIKEGRRVDPGVVQGPQKTAAGV